MKPGIRDEGTGPTRTMSLRAAAAWAREYRGPTRVWRILDGTTTAEITTAEVFFHRDLVVHGRFGATLTGLAAIRAIHALGPVAFTVQPACWPDAHSLLIPWDSLWTKLDGPRPRPIDSPAAIYRDDDTTASLEPDAVRWRQSTR